MKNFYLFFTSIISRTLNTFSGETALTPILNGRNINQCVQRYPARCSMARWTVGKNCNRTRSSGIRAKFELKPALDGKVRTFIRTRQALFMRAAGPCFGS
jgi:hypothetical protein